MNELHSKTNPALWSGRTSDRQEYLHEKVRLAGPGLNTKVRTDAHSFVLLGYACDEGVRRNGGRVGAAEGPDAIRRELGKMANHLPSRVELIDMGNVVCPEGDLEKTQEVLSRLVAKTVGQGGIPLLLGGGHDISYAHYSGLRSALPRSQSLGIINFDAHFDLRTNQNGNHSGSPFYQIAMDCQKDDLDFHYLCLGIRREANPPELFQRAEELGVDYMELQEFSMLRWDEVSKRLGNFLSTTDKVYVTVDMDGFSSAFSPGVSAASPVGFSPEIALACLHQIVISGKLLGMDVAETNPKYDRDQQTAKLAAGIIHRVMHETSLL
ncbi:formimidoylglutamase [Muriicola marianensis]|uniref:Formimidoylglutamase n=1 Tax=Muriicola marianensis TaxID=1324801 RepID=A0ABQ1QWD3_9FLAO|nr:formimidoylglutamase [Muriicola marianensis]GGD47221.1 formimidoylglutamase [Muriicola marianensis]